MESPAYPFTVAVLSGKGGVGKTTLALNLAKSLSRRYGVWLIDLDLHNRGATAIVWESEDQIPVSVAGLILDAMSLGEDETAEEAFADGSGILGLYLQQARDEKEKPALAAEVEAKLRKRIAYSLSRYLDWISFGEELSFLAAAKAGEGRLASHLLWKFEKDWKETAFAFLPVLLKACGEVSPGSMVILDGHGSLDDLTIAAAGAAHLTYIVNEPDLATFSGSLTLFREICEAYEDAVHEPRIEFIINRVPPEKSLRKMEADFGVLLRGLSPSRRAIAAYFPIEPELFGVFGRDPFVSEIFTHYWFSRKIDLLSAEIADHGASGYKLPPPGEAFDVPPPGRARERIRFALKREFHKRGDLLLILWLVLICAVEGYLVLQPLQVWEGATAVSWPLYAATAAGGILLVQTLRWFSVQWRHVRNNRNLRGARKLQAEPTASTKKAEGLETQTRIKILSGTWKLGLAVAILLAVFSAITIPSLLGSLARAKAKRAQADVRNVGTAWMAWLIDQIDQDSTKKEGSPHQGPRFEVIPYERLVGMLRPSDSFNYITDVPELDPWGDPYEFRLSSNLWSANVIIICSSGVDGKGRCAQSLANPIFSDWDYPIPKEGFWKSDAVKDLFPPEAIVWADGYFVQAPGLVK